MTSELTNEQRSLICRISADEESGGHLLHKRGGDYYEMCRLIYSLCDEYETRPRSKFEQEVLDYYRATKDPGLMAVYDSTYKCVPRE